MAGVVAPERGDLMLRGSFGQGFEVLDAETMHPVVEGVHSLAEALAFAQQRGPCTLWQLNVDDRGRMIGAPFRIPVAKAS